MNIYFEADKYYGVAFRGSDVVFFSLEEAPEDNLYWDFNTGNTHIYNGFKAYKITATTLNGESMPVEDAPEVFIPYYRKQDPSQNKWGGEYQSEPSNFGGGFFDLGSRSEFDWGDASSSGPNIPVVFMVPSTTEIPDCDDIVFPVGPIGPFS